MVHEHICHIGSGYIAQCEGGGMTSGEYPATDEGERRVVATMDRSGPRPRVVIAERGTDAASLSALAAATCSLREWR
jgi:hypothetical protein